MYIYMYIYIYIYIIYCCCCFRTGPAGPHVYCGHSTAPWLPACTSKRRYSSERRSEGCVASTPGALGVSEQDKSAALVPEQRTSNAGTQTFAELFFTLQS